MNHLTWQYRVVKMRHATPARSFHHSSHYVPKQQPKSHEVAQEQWGPILNDRMAAGKLRWRPLGHCTYPYPPGMKELAEARGTVAPIYESICRPGKSIPRFCQRNSLPTLGCPLHARNRATYARAWRWSSVVSFLRFFLSLVGGCSI